MKLHRIAATATALVSLAACTAHSTAASPTSSAATEASPPSPSPSVTSEPVSASPTPTPAPAPFVHSLSGLAGTAGKTVVAVKIDNTPPARPQTNVNAADIVYVELVEGDATRLMAVFQSAIPEVVGPVRSGRESDIEILAAYGKVALAYSGAQRGVERLIRAAPLHPYEEGAAGFFRSSARNAPYNLYLNAQSLLRAHPDLPTARDLGWVFGPALPGGVPTASISVKMSPYTTYGFLYDASSKRWLASINGKPTVQKDGQRLSATNVLVQEVSVTVSRFHDILGLYTPRTHTVGTGAFTLLRPDGTRFTGTWSRPRAADPTTYTDASGTPVTFAPGRTWVLLAPKGNAISTK